MLLKNTNYMMLVKKLIDKAKLPFYRSLTKWRPLLITSFNIDPLKCPNCGTIMDFVYAFT